MNQCIHIVMKVEGELGIAQICIKCGKTRYIDKIPKTDKIKEPRGKSDGKA
jgi:hypothetical protein